jgi:uncharacterized protein DUF5753
MIDDISGSNPAREPFETYMEVEARSSVIRYYASTVVPGLLQTLDYARAILTGLGEWTPDEVNRRLATRHRRQALHRRCGPPEMVFLLDEAVIRRQVGGPNVMRGQLDRLQDWSIERHVAIRLVPFAAWAQRPACGSFVVLETLDPASDGNGLVYLENYVDTTHLGEAERYVERFTALEEVALSANETVMALESARPGLAAA